MARVEWNIFSITASPRATAVSFGGSSPSTALMRPFVRLLTARPQQIGFIFCSSGPEISLILAFHPVPSRFRFRFRCKNYNGPTTPVQYRSGAKRTGANLYRHRHRPVVRLRRAPPRRAPPKDPPVFPRGLRHTNKTYLYKQAAHPRTTPQSVAPNALPSELQPRTKAGLKVSAHAHPGPLALPSRMSGVCPLEVCPRPSFTPAFHSPCLSRGSAMDLPGTQPGDSASGSSAPESILVLHNVAKKKNFGELIRTAAALGVCEIIIVGAQKLSSFGSHGTCGHVRFSHFDKLADAVAYLHGARGARLCGVEITPDSAPVQTHPFGGTTAFLMGNEGQGLTPSQLAVCDHFVYIPQHSDATASLNVNAACAVVLHHFAMHAAFPESARDGYKFVQGPPPSSTPNSGIGLKQMKTLAADGSVVPRRRGPSAEEDDAEDDADDGRHAELERAEPASEEEAHAAQAEVAFGADPQPGSD